jgi:hypothetical protein
MTHITIEKEKLEGILAALESLSRWSDYYGRDIGERDEMVFLKAALAQPAPAQTDSFQFDIDEDVQLLMDRDMGDN